MQVATSSAVYVFPLLSPRAEALSMEVTKVLDVLQPLLAAPDVFKCGVGRGVHEALQAQQQGQLQLRYTPHLYS